MTNLGKKIIVMYCLLANCVIVSCRKPCSSLPTSSTSLAPHSEETNTAIEPDRKYKPFSIDLMNARYREYLSYVDEITANHQDAYNILREHLWRAMAAYTEDWSQESFDNIAKMQLSNLFATSDHQEALVNRFGEPINFKDVFVPATPFSENEDGTNIALIDSGFNGVPLMEMDRIIAFYTFNPQTEMLELVDNNFIIPEYAVHMARQFHEVGGLDFNAGSKFGKCFNLNSADSPVLDLWEILRSPLSQNLEKNVKSIKLKRDINNKVTITTNPYSQLVNNLHFVNSIKINAAPVLSLNSNNIFKRQLIYDRDRDSNAHGAKLVQIITKNAPKNKFVLVDLEYLSTKVYRHKDEADAVFLRVQNDIDKIFAKHNVHFVTRAMVFRTCFEGDVKRNLESDRYENGNFPDTYMDIFGGIYHNDHDEGFIESKRRLVRLGHSTSLVVNSFSHGCEFSSGKLDDGFSADYFKMWAQQRPNIKEFSFTRNFSINEILDTNEVFINRHACFNFYEHPNLTEYPSCFDEIEDPYCFINQHQSSCKDFSSRQQAQHWKSGWKTSTRPDYQWSEYLGAGSKNADLDVKGKDYIYEIRSRKFDGDTSSMTALVASWASYVKRVKFAGQPRNSELYRKIKERITGGGEKPFQDPLLKDELPVFLDGRGGKLAQYRIKRGLFRERQDNINCGHCSSTKQSN